MKFSLSIKIIVILSVFLLCAGVGVYSFMRLNSVEQRKDFNLYALVPQDAVAVFETDRMVDMLEVMGRMKCSEDGHNLHASYLFSCLKKYLDTLMAETPHALSKQMNKILISFHTPDTQADQVLYCTLGEGDRDLLENFIRKYCPESFPVKTSKYRGQEIRIYPMNNGQFLAHKTSWHSVFKRNYWKKSSMPVKTDILYQTNLHSKFCIAGRYAMWRRLFTCAPALSIWDCRRTLYALYLIWENGWNST